MRMPVTALALAVIAVGCAADSENDAVILPPNDPSLDRQIAELEPGTSSEAIKARLGEPFDENTAEFEPGLTMLFYGRWRLDFEDGKLSRRIKYLATETAIDDQVVDRQTRAVNRAILATQPGSTVIAEARSKFGRPDTYEIVANTPETVVVLSYGEWELTFVDGTLEHRQK